MSLEQETAEYYNYLLRIKRVKFEQELLEIISNLTMIQLWNNPMTPTRGQFFQINFLSFIGVYTSILHAR